MRVVTLLTDFGTQDPYVGIMKGTILGICPEARMVDLTHQVIPYQIPQAAFLLQESWRWFPEGTIHLVVVDPGVGSERRAIAMEAEGHFFVGPDNGVFSLVPAGEVRELTTADAESRTFHGRDVFAPAAARLAKGAKLSDLGGIILDPARLIFAEATVLHIDRFGNVITSLRPAPGIAVRVGQETIRRHARTYSEVPAGELFLIEGSSGYLEIALNQGSAGERLGAGVGFELEVI